MLFNSPEFLFCYLPIVLVGFALLGRWGRRAVVAWLAIASLAFYAYWRPAFLLLLCGSILVNYATAALIWRNRERPGHLKLWMIIGIALNLGALCFFKYLFPFLHFVRGAAGFHFSVGSVILPLGISFFTFTQIAYLVDLAQGAAEPQDFVSYVLFVTFFPHLIAGPILHHGEIMPQFAEGRDFSLKANDVALGLSWFVLGLAKKVLIADRLAPFADTTFAHPLGLSVVDSWLGVLNYAMQLYFDFSGYSDMALGSARMFSIELPINFNSPYKADNIIEFWQRWHITLTRYLTLYLYNPCSMAINRRRAAAGKSNSRKATKTIAGFGELVALPTVLTMFLAGIWHGAGLQFILFGTLHGIYISANHAWRIFVPEESAWAKLVGWRPLSLLMTFLAVCVAQVFFRSTSTHDAFALLAGMVGLNGLGVTHVTAASAVSHSWLAHSTSLARSAPLLPSTAAIVFLLFPIVWFLPNTQEILGQARVARREIVNLTYRIAWQPTVFWATSLALVFIAVLWRMTNTSTFLYFQF
jgi:D-alanyl-lipoteichoic acid acyltransferase DltB (MBOAT superfamily)